MPDTHLDGVGPDAGFFAGEGIAGAVEGLIAGVMFLAEGAEVVFAGPAVDGEVVAGDVGVPEQFGAKVVGRGAEELGPGAIGRIGGFKRRDFLFGNFELPNDDEHAGPLSRLYGSAGGWRGHVRSVQSRRRGPDKRACRAGRVG